MELTDADLVRGQAPGLSALVTHRHTHACTHTYTDTHIHPHTHRMRFPFTLGLSEAAIPPSGGICVLLGRERDIGVLMNNAAGNEMGDGDRHAGRRKLVYVYFAVV